MKKKMLTFVVSLVLAAMMTGCSSSGTATKETTKAETTTSETKEAEITEAPVKEESSSSSSSYKKSSTSSSSTKTSTSFTNKYGTPTTKCAKAGCNNYIASSGDTCYCPTHSNRCLECSKYIDGDAMYCLDCIAKAASEVSESKSSSSSYGSGSSSYGSSSSSYGSGSSSYGSSGSSGGGYGYDPSDPYYSANDHDGDGKLSDQEFQDAMNDAIDDLLAAYGE